MRVAVVDIGSNSIKLLVADGPGRDEVREVLSRTLEVRISGGIASREPRLGVAGMQRGAAAVAELAAEARALGAVPVAVATSAVRDAANGAEFRERVRAEAGVEVRILSGLEEAGFIGRGLTTDPALRDLRDFQDFDLGGGSLECLSFRDRRVERAVSLPLGCVRLTEALVADPSLPLGEAQGRRIGLHVRDALVASGFPLPVPQGFGVVGTGGTLTTLRAMEAAARGVRLEAVDPTIEVAVLHRILERVGSMDLAGRRAIPGLSGARADVFPTALATLAALADLGEIRAFRHSLRNLRWGVAAALLAGEPLG